MSMSILTMTTGSHKREVLTHCSKLPLSCDTTLQWIGQVTSYKKESFHSILHFAYSKFTKFESHLLFGLCGFTNDSLYKIIFKTKINLSIIKPVDSSVLGQVTKLNTHSIVNIFILQGISTRDQDWMQPRKLCHYAIYRDFDFSHKLLEHKRELMFEFS